MKKTNKLSIVLILNLIIFLFMLSCNNRLDDKRLINENMEMKNEIQKLKNKLNSLSYRPIIVPQSNKIKLGDEYIADVIIAVVDTSAPPTIILGNYDTIKHDFTATSDTLKYDLTHECSVYRIKPTERGSHIWSSMMIHHLNGNTTKYILTGAYEVQ